MKTVISPEVKAVDVPGLKATCKRHGITHDYIAAEAHVTRPMVVNVFAGRVRSRNVVTTAERLVAEAERKLARARARKRQSNGEGRA